MQRFIKTLVGVIFLIILAWLAIWFYAEIRLKQLVEADITQINASNSGGITFDKLTTSHFPWVVSVGLINPRITIKPAESQSPLSISAAKIGAHMDLFHPFTLHVDFPLKIVIGQPQGAGILRFVKADVTETLNPSIWLGNTLNPVLSSTANFTDIHLLASNGSLELAKIDYLALNQETATYASKDQTAITFTEEMLGFHLSPLFTRLFGVPFDGEIKTISSSISLSGPLNAEQSAKQEMSLSDDDQRRQFLMQTLHQWAQSGGHAQGFLYLQIGPSQMQTNFTLAFDKNVQPEGDVRITASQLDQFSTAISTAYPSLKASISRVEATLAPYLSTTSQNGQILNMHATYGQKGVFVNGQKTGVEPYLNWNILLSSTPAPAFAPGDGSGAEQP